MLQCLTIYLKNIEIGKVLMVGYTIRKIKLIAITYKKIHYCYNHCEITVYPSNAIGSESLLFC